MRGGKSEAPAPLHLHAADTEDLPVVSAALSSAAVKRGDMRYDPRRRRFALVCNRFRWEGGEFEDGLGGSRIRAGVQINDVESVQSSGFSSLPDETVLELLSLQAEAGETPPEAVLTLTFAGGPAVRLKTGCVDVLVDDMGRAWYTPNRPDHEQESGDGA